MFDVMIVGGSYAGLAAALQLGRARQTVLVVDGGVRRNRFASHSHGFLGQDGVDPATIVGKGRAEVLAYPSVTWLEGRVIAARGALDDFALRLASGEEHRGKRVILAYGVADELPEVPGLAERWGQSAFHCPYCHGYELDQGAIAVLASSPMSIHQALMLPDWGAVTYYTRGLFEPTSAERVALDRRRVRVVSEPVSAVGGEAPRIEVELADGGRETFSGLFVASRTRPTANLAEALGCAMEEGPTGPFIKTDAMKATTVPGVLAAGDAAIAAGSVTFAVGDGARAGFNAHRTLLFGWT
jgi:thioredoxin reductase